jgi:hypothetical protein
MFPHRVVRPYFVSCLAVALCFCIFKHAILTTTSEFGPETASVELLPKQSAAKVIRFVTSSSVASGVPVRPDTERTRNADAGSSSPAGNETSRRHIVNSATSSRHSALLGNDLATPDEKECLTEALGLPAHVAEQCYVVAGSPGNVSGSSSSPACSRLTCSNLIGDPSLADELSRIAADFIRSHPVRIPTDDELAASSGSCDIWRSKYGFERLLPSSSDEIDFPLAFNILVHENAHQVRAPSWTRQVFVTLT